MSRLSEKKKALVEKMMRESVFSAAEDLLEEEGWKGTTMEKIAQKAGVSKGTVYNYFKDKKDILSSILDRNTEGIRQLVRSIDLDIETPRRILEAVLSRILEDIYRERSIIAATMQAYYEDAELRREWDHTCNNQSHPMWEIRAFLTRVIAKGVEAGEFRPVDPIMAEAMINATINGLAEQFSMNLLNFSSDPYISVVRDVLIKGLCVENGTHLSGKA